MTESSTTSRALRLLELLQARRFRPGNELADRLGVTGRTLRRDIERLRELGYRVAARRGPEGGYGLSVGSELPPLVFTPDEAISIAAALSSFAASSAAASVELALTALAKVEQVMPSASRRRVQALRTAVALGAPPDLIPLDPGVLAALALACRDGERLRLRYLSASGPDAGEERGRHVEPARLVPRGARWYLLCWDLDRHDWRTLRADRIARAEATGVRAAPRPIPRGDAAAFVAERLGRLPTEHSATILIHAPLAEVEGYLGAYARNLASGQRADGTPATRWHIVDARLESLAAGLVWLPWPFEVTDSRELAELLRDRARRFAAAAQHTLTTRDPR